MSTSTTPPASTVYGSIQQVLRLLLTSREGTSLRGSIGKPHSACATLDEFLHHAERSVFEALSDVSAEAEQSLETFDVTAYQRVVLNRAVRYLRAAMPDNDLRARNSCRRVVNDQGRGRAGSWDAWRIQIPQERAYDQGVLESLWTDVRAALSPADAELLEQVYRRGIEPKALAAQMVATNPAYAGPGGFDRAHQNVWQRLSRARARASERLPSTWRDRARDIA